MPLSKIMDKLTGKDKESDEKEVEEPEDHDESDHDSEEEREVCQFC